MDPFGFSLTGFLVAWVISAIIVYIASKLIWAHGGILTAILAALVGAIIYTLVGSLLAGLIGSLLALVGWLLALKFLYRIGWLRAGLLALVIWIFAVIASFFLPTLPGPF
jgi:hypothetical protein